MNFEDKALIVGLTGMSGAGKTSACDVFRESGFSVIDCDKTARAIVEAGKPALKEIAERFGEEYLNADGTLDRRKLGSLVFSSEADRLALNEIIYPYISYDIISDIMELIRQGSRYILLDAPTLFESGADALCGAVVSIAADIEKCVERIMTRDSLTPEQARDRLSSQHTLGFYKEHSDFCILNNGIEAELKEKVREAAEKLKERGDVR